MKYYLVAAACFCMLLSCEKEIKININQQAPKLVVDASIENNGVPLVALSTSLNYFNTISPEELANSFVHDAVVTVGNGTQTVTLKEYSITDTSGFTLFYYSVDSSDFAQILIGELDKTYTLNVTTKDGETYSSTTTIPRLTKTVDSLFWKPVPFVEDTTLCALMLTVTDPPGLGNYVRYFTSVNNGRFLPGLNSVFDDQVVDGITVTLQFDAGWDKNSLEDPIQQESYGFVHRGDTVTLKYCNIDRATYLFWNTWEFAWQSNGNPFSTPGKVLGNISNGALGGFSGYAVQYKTLIIPK
ncbi:DUF4249 domain-containing protein [Panacibacter sp. DH6]|uniref:DUF4249 domain-containing protein n=1 Tax=Panacibacter microcysteis TaxID=2793269 RepID=A0A931GTY2_9BACT|nr:DUF4249 domain-containing protein [Panacibacter microcysteis]MBG9374815.1 DUF4249 domain-containing protein [Panacibacter microcysteis]